MSKSKMINYAKHDEEFYGVFKLMNGEEVLGRAVLTKEEGTNESLVFIQDPVACQVINKEIDENKVARGIGFAPWQQMSDEEFFIIREKDILTIATMKKEIVLMYEAYILGDDANEERKKRRRLGLNKNLGFIGKIDHARDLFEKIYKQDTSNP